MYCVRDSLENGVNFNVTINAANFYQICDNCEKDIPIDRETGQIDGSIFDITYCDECNRNIERLIFNKVHPSSLDEMIWMENEASRKGLDDELEELYSAFEINYSKDLSPEQRPFFGMALLLLVHSSPNGDFAHVPEHARNGMTDHELDEALKEMGLPPEWEEAVRSACKYGIKKSY